MYLNTLLTAAALYSSVLAQDEVPALTIPTGISPEETAIVSDSYEYVLLAAQDPAILSIAMVAATALPSSQVAEFLQNPQDVLPVPTLTDITAFATEPIPDLPTPTWIGGLPEGVQGDLLAAQTSIYEGVQSIVASHLSLEAPTETAEGAGARPTAPILQVVGGVVAGAAGVAALL